MKPINWPFNIAWQRAGVDAIPVVPHRVHTGDAPSAPLYSGVRLHQHRKHHHQGRIRHPAVGSDERQDNQLR